MKVEPVVLEGEFVRLEPMRVDHLPALAKVGLDESLWKWTNAVVKTEADLERYVRTALADQAKGTAIPFLAMTSSTRLNAPAGRLWPSLAITTTFAP